MARKQTEKINIKGFGNLYTNIPMGYSWNKDTVSITQSGTAEMIRQDIARMFPGRKFWVRSESYSGGDSIRVYTWNYPEKDFEQVKKLEYRYKDGTFNGMEDIYENREKEPIYTTDGKRVDYGAKFIFVDNKPPYDSKEREMPVPDYSSSSKTNPEPKSGSGSGSRSSKFKSKGSGKPNPIREDSDYRYVMQLSTGWDVFLKYYGSDNCRIALVFDYKVGQAVYNSEKWTAIKEKLLQVSKDPDSYFYGIGLVWDLKDKCFYTFRTLADNEVSPYIYIEQAHKLIMDKAIYSINDTFKEFGYTQVRENKLSEENTPWYKDKSNEEEMELLDEIEGLGTLQSMETDPVAREELQKTIDELWSVHELLYRKK